MALEDVEGHFGVVVAQQAPEELEEASDVGQQLTELLVRAVLQLSLEQQRPLGSPVPSKDITTMQQLLQLNLNRVP